MDITRSLAQISTEYSVFEEDQVLTHDQLNSIARYLDDQTRLTRINLLGVGIACGLRVSVQAGKVKVTPGVGVTTDGDLLHFSSDTVFDKFKLYDTSQPKYAPFYTGGTMITVYELAPEGTRDDRAKPLSQFGSQTGSSLNATVAVLLMESYEKDRDLCSGTDCDNLGKDCRNTLRLLLVDRAVAGPLQQTVATPHQAFGEIHEIVADRPLISSAIQSFSQLVQAYRTACDTIHGRLAAELPRLYPACSGFLSDVFPSNPSTAWISRLNAVRTAFGSNASGVQYYYDFLKDLVETYNDFRDLLFGDTTWCCPGTEAFPKHLLLGNLVPGTNPDENRTAFYPSPVASRTVEQLNHARFLARKLDTLILTFQLPAAAGTPLRVTPSLSEDQPLEERAIPYYYQVNSTHPVHQNWNYRLHARGMDAHNYSYHASSYGAQGAAADPLTAQIGRFSFFRIEGHLGQTVSTALSALESEIQTRNLPFAVRSVMLGADKGKVVRPGIRYTDIHRLHYVLRQDIFHQLDEVMQFSGKFKQQVDDAVTANTITNSPDDYDGPDIKGFVAEKHAAVAGKASSARDKLNRRYSEYKKEASWKADFNDTLKAAGEFKYNLGKVVKTEFNTPFDSLISNAHVQWLDWLDEIVKKKDDREDEKLLFTKFVTLHPGLEHFAGVSRGGTFVLVYDSDSRVVADFMLPYFSCEEIEEENEEAPLPKPGLKPGWIIDNGIKIFPSRDRFVKEKLTKFRDDLEPVWENKFNAQKETYFKIFEDSFTVMGNVFTQFERGVTPVEKGAVIADRELAGRVNQTREKRQVVDYLRQKAAQPDLPLDRKKVYEEQIKEAETDLAKTITETAKYIDSSGTDVSMGSAGMAAMVEMNQGLASVRDTQAVETVNTTFDNLRGTSGNAGFKLMLGNMIRR